MQNLELSLNPAIAAALAARPPPDGSAHAAADDAAAVCAALDAWLAQAVAAELGRDDAHACVLAVAALADATATRDKTPYALAWRPQRLVVHYFGAAGPVADAFTERLAQLRLTGRAEVLQLYATCLALGCRGRLRPAAAQALLLEVCEQLEPTAAAPPAWERAVVGMRGRAGLSPPLGVALLAATVCAGLYVVLSAAQHTAVAGLAGAAEALLAAAP